MDNLRIFKSIIPAPVNYPDIQTPVTVYLIKNTPSKGGVFKKTA